MCPVFWFFGPSGAGKTTLSSLLAKHFQEQSITTVVIDGDDLRRGLCSDLGFSEEARNENHRRAAEMALITSQQNVVTIVATMAPQQQQRGIVRQTVGPRLRFIFVDTPLERCIERDPKNLYKRPLGQGNPQDVLFEIPSEFEVSLVVKAGELPIEDCSNLVVRFATAEFSCMASR